MGFKVTTHSSGKGGGGMYLKRTLSPLGPFSPIFDPHHKSLSLNEAGYRTSCVDVFMCIFLIYLTTLYELLRPLA